MLSKIFFGTLQGHLQCFGVQCADLKSIFNHVRNPLKNKVVQVG